MKKLLKKLGIEDKKDFWAFVWQAFKFGVVGLSNTAISLVTYYIFKAFFPQKYLWGNALGFFLGTLNSYFFNSRFVFAQKADQMPPKKGGLLRTFAVYGSTFLLAQFLLWFLVEKIQISANLAPFLILCITVPLNFLLSKYWALKEE